MRQLNISICEYFTNAFIKGLTFIFCHEKQKVHMEFILKQKNQLKNKINSAFKKVINHFQSLHQIHYINTKLINIAHTKMPMSLF